MPIISSQGEQSLVLEVIKLSCVYETAFQIFFFSSQIKTKSAGSSAAYFRMFSENFNNNNKKRVGVGNEAYVSTSVFVLRPYHSFWLFAILD